jgi:hypothetical protein
MPLSLSAVLFGYELHAQHALRALLALRAMCAPCTTQLITDALPTQPLPNGYFVKVQAMRAGPTHWQLRCEEGPGREQDTSQQDKSQGLG